MIWKLLKHNISVWQIAGYAVATLIGLAIVMVGVQFYGDLRSAFGNTENDGIDLIPAHNIVISKPVGIKSTFSGEAPAFTDDEIADIAAQDWAGRVEQFQAADFGVYGGIDFGGRSLQSAMFFESIPDDLVDIDSADWQFDPAAPTVPIVVSKDYLTLYNFGFAASGNMPMVSENVIGSLPLQVALSGNGRRDVFPARIVGFSSWLNTIAVPQQFMDWAHERYGSGRKTAPSRLIVEVADPADPQVEKYIDGHNYEVAGPQNNLGRASYMLRLVTTVVVAVGGIITLLALFILVLSLYLLITKNRRAIHGLLMLGYTPGAVDRSYMALVACINGIVAALAVVAVIVARGYWLPSIEAMGEVTASIWQSAVLGVAVMFVITLINFGVIARLVRTNFR